jgi:ketosteroid isomerase-like protein
MQSNSLDLAEDYVKAINSGDVATLLSYYETDAILMVMPGKMAR